MQTIGIKAIKLIDLYLTPEQIAQQTTTAGGLDSNNDTEIVAARLASGDVADLERLAARYFVIVLDNKEHFLHMKFF